MLRYYETLGVARNSSLEEIKKSYKKLAFEYHPDRNGGGDSTKFLEIQEAYQYLLKNHKPRKNDSSFTNMFNDMMKSMHKEQNKNHIIHLDIPILDAIKGVEKTLNIKFDVVCGCSFIIRDRCPKCGGLGYITEEKLGVFRFDNIAHQNQTYLYRNYHKGINLQIKINVLPNEEFYLKKDCVHTDVRLDIFKAILGGRLEVKTPRSVGIIEIPEGQIKNFSYRLQDQGLTGKDLIINFKIYLPKNLTFNQKKLLNIIIDENKKEQS